MTDINLGQIVIPGLTKWSFSQIRCHSVLLQQIPHPPPDLPLKGEEGSDFPPLQGEGQGGGGVKYVTEFMKYTTKPAPYLIRGNPGSRSLTNRETE